MRKEGEIMRYRQIFLVVSSMLIAYGCSGGDTDGQMRREFVEKEEEY